jgi:methylmalonyl-CoA mutase N-terminal domain/subunit
MVGVNRHVDEDDRQLELLRISHTVETEQKRRLAEVRAQRDEGRVRESLRRLAEQARTDVNLIPAMLDAVRAEATLGELSTALQEVWGRHAEPAWL